MNYKQFKEQIMRNDEYYVNENPYSVFVYRKGYISWYIRISKIDINDYEFRNNRNSNGESNKEIIDNEIKQTALELINTPLKERGGIKTVMAFKSEEW